MSIPVPIAGQVEDENPYVRRIVFARQEIDPPGDEYLTVDDVMVLSLWSPTAASTVQLSVRILAPSGVVDPRFEILAGQTTGTTPATLVLRNMEGFLLSASITSPNAPSGQAFVTLEIVRGRGSADLTRGAVLIAGYPDQGRSIGYPETPVRSSLDGRGMMRIVTGAVPAAGAEISDTVPAGRQWILRAARFTLVASAVVAIRRVSLTIDDGLGNVPLQASAAGTQVAGVTQVYSVAAGFSDISNAQAQQVHFALEARLLPGWRIRTVTALIDVGDQYTAAVYLVEEFITA